MDRYPKRLIEVDLSIKRISEHARYSESSDPELDPSGTDCILPYSGRLYFGNTLHGGISE